MTYRSFSKERSAAPTTIHKTLTGARRATRAAAAKIAVSTVQDPASVNRTLSATSSPTNETNPPPVAPRNLPSRLDYRIGAVIPAFTPGELYGTVPELAEIANLTTKKLFGVFSEHMGPVQYKALAIAVGEEIEKGADGIVIGHGTDTMAHTGAILSFLVQDSPVPIVLVGTGLGHVNKPIRPAIRRAIEKGMTVVMTVQTLWGFAQMYVYDTGRDLLDLGIIPLDNMLPETAYMKFAWVLGQTDDPARIREMMTTAVNHEITPRELHNGYLILHGGLPEVEAFVQRHWK